MRKKVRSIRCWRAALGGLVMRLPRDTYAARRLSGPVGEALARLCPSGDGHRILFLDKTPGDSNGHLLVLGYSDGVVVIFHTEGRAHAEIVQMCPEYRTRIVGGVGSIRWAKLKVGA